MGSETTGYSSDDYIEYLVLENDLRKKEDYVLSILPLTLHEKASSESDPFEGDVYDYLAEKEKLRYENKKLLHSDLPAYAKLYDSSASSDSHHHYRFERDIYDFTELYSSDSDPYHQYYDLQSSDHKSRYDRHYGPYEDPHRAHAKVYYTESDHYSDSHRDY